MLAFRLLGLGRTSDATPPVCGTSLCHSGVACLIYEEAFRSAGDISRAIFANNYTFTRGLNRIYGVAE